jgi:quinolinate synthase
MVEEILKLKKERDAVILAHNYQIPEVQDIADIVGDSLDLSRKAADTEARVIVFCGVRFMAETAKLLSPKKTVLLPRPDAGCFMADMISVEDLRALKKKHPKAKVVAYVNTNADVKAEADICCTSANAVRIVESLDADEVIFVPDRNLASWVQAHSTKRIIAWDGFCAVHERISASEVAASRLSMKDAPILAHPECRAEVLALADAVLSTNGMLDYVSTSPARRFLVATEEGILHRMRKLNPHKEFHAAGGPKACINMKKTTLSDILESLTGMKYDIQVPSDVAGKAGDAIRLMLEASR